MKKRQVHVLIDTTDYIHMESKNINKSELIRRLLRSYFQSEKVETDKDKIINTIKEKEETEKELKEEISLLRMQLFQLEEEERKNSEERQREGEALVRGIKASGWLGDID